MGIMVDNSTTTRKATDIKIKQQREEKYNSIKIKQQDTDNLKKQQEIII